MTSAFSVPRLDRAADRWLNRRSVALIALLLAYGGAFTALHHVAAQWAAGDLFSLWFPAAGLRFAFLWRVGARMAPAAALSELSVQLATGEASLGTAPVLAVMGIVAPCLVYGLVIHLVRGQGERRATILGHAPLPFALAAVIGPIVACAAALPWAIPLAMERGPIDGTSLLHSLLVFGLGDMLGVLIVAPPLLWLADRIEGKQRWALPSLRLALAAELLLVTAAAWAVVWAIDRAGMGLMLGPVLLATCWVGLRAGRTGAWLSILLAAAIILPLSDQRADDDVQLQLNMLLACVAAVGYLAGSFAEAEAKSHAELERRNRLLYQAERLKTLRAMSVAVIHEISQPLSTISIEANSLIAASSRRFPDHGEIVATSQLIARKAQDLSHMVRRLRGFGDRAADAPSPIAMAGLLREVATIAGPEAKASNVTLQFLGGPDASMLGHDIELRQALLNLVRNAIAASPRPGQVVVSHAVSGGRVLVTVANEQGPAALRAGMGVGLIIARSIAAAHGGAIHERRPGPQHFCFILDLPVLELAHD
jgi:signal transduction histidine kinase